MPIAMMFFMVIGMVTVAAVGVSTTSDNMAHRASQKAEATALAQSGVNELYDQIVRDLQAGKNPSDLASKSMSSAFGGDTRQLGTYSATIADTTFSAGPSGKDYTFLVKGTGVAPNGTQSIVTAEFTATLSGTLGTGSGSRSTFSLFPGAILSNTTVDMVTNMGVRTYDASAIDKEAHILGNEGIMWKPFSGTKDQYVNPNIIDVQGYAMVPDQPSTYPLDFSKGVSGLGNPNGTKNYRTAAAHVNTPDPYSVAQDEITGIGQPKPFPTISEWQTYFTTGQNTIASSAAKTQYSTSITSANVPQRAGDQWRIIKAPAIINGDMEVTSGTQIRLMPSSNAAENIVYVTGNIRNYGQLLNLGVTVMVAGKYSDNSTAEYKVDNQGTTWKDLAEVYAKSALISASFSKQAITLSSNSSVKTGLMYAANGGIKVTGNLEINGILVSGGVNSENLKIAGIGPNQAGSTDYSTLGGKVDISPANGNSFVVHYVREASTFKLPFQGTAGSGTPTLLGAGRLTAWNQIK